MKHKRAELQKHNLNGQWQPVLESKGEIEFSIQSQDMYIKVVIKGLSTYQRYEKCIYQSKRDLDLVVT